MPASGGELRSERHVVRSDTGRVASIVRRIHAGDHASARYDALRVAQAQRVPGFVLVQDVRLAKTSGAVEVAEQYVTGFSLAQAARPIQDDITVNVALAIIYDIARALVALHTVDVPGQGTLIHGALEPSHVIVTTDGTVLLSGLEGRTGVPADDVPAVMRIMRHILQGRARTKEGAVLLDRLSSLTFTNCKDLAHSIHVYLQRQDPEELSRRRQRFVESVVEYLRVAESEEPTAAADDLADLDPFADAPWGSLEADGDYAAYFDELGGSIPTIAGDQLEEIPGQGGSTAVDFVPDLGLLPIEHTGSETVEAAPAPVDLLKSRTDSVLGPLEPPETDVFDEIDEELGELERTVDADESEIPLDPDARAGLLGRARTPSPDQQVHAVIVGDYKVVASIGRGGMGEIYLARSKREGLLGDLVALKVLAAEGQDDEEALDMLLDEAAIMARIEHPNVLRVVDFGRAAGRYFLATEYLEGRPLVRVMIEAYNRESGLDYGVIAAIGADAANGLFAAHTATNDLGKPLHIVHRDVSPQNIFVTYGGVSKVIDFGVARATERVSRTEVGLVKGKAAYMSPEQAEGRPVDARSDVFSLGVCLWEMTAGKRLFKCDNEYDTLLAVQSLPVEPPTVVRGDPNPILDHIILEALERDVAKRTPSARELALQLIDYASGVGIADRDDEVAALLGRLFGEAARAERELITSLELGAATEDEAAQLEALSGVSQSSKVRRITMVGEADGLARLDDFGRQGPSLTPVQSKPKSSSKHVIERVQRIQAERSIPPRAASPEPTPTPVDPPLVKEAIVEEGFDADPTRRLSSEVLESMTVPAIGDGDIVDVDLDLDTGFEPIERSSVQETAPAAQVVAGGGEPKKRRSQWPLVLAAAAIVCVTAGAAAMVLMREGPMRVTGMEPNAELDEALDPPLVAPPARTASVARSASSGGMAARVETASVATSSASAAPPVQTKNVSVESFVALLGEQGVGVSESEGTYLVDDGDGGTLAFDEDAQITRVESASANGFVVEAESKALTSVGWIGRTGDGPWRVRGLSINDCPAKLQIHANGLSLRYGGQEIRVRHGGGVLTDVQLERPERATRLEIDPVGLSFGAPDETSDVIHCKTGWWGSRVVVRRLPVGQYTLRWIGDGVATTARLEVTPDTVRGGQVVRRTE